MHYAGRRHYLADASPLRSMPFYRTVESVFGASRQVSVEAELRNARAEWVGWMAGYREACAKLGKANKGVRHRTGRIARFKAQNTNIAVLVWRAAGQLKAFHHC